MPPKYRELKAELRKAGFALGSGNGSHTNWRHPLVPGLRVTLSGNDGDDARRRGEGARSAAGAAMSHRGERGHYSMVLEWDPRDRSYIATVPELPGCRTHGATLEEAVKNGQDVIGIWI